MAGFLILATSSDLLLRARSAMHRKCHPRAEPLSNPRLHEPPRNLFTTWVLCLKEAMLTSKRADGIKLPRLEESTAHRHVHHHTLHLAPNSVTTPSRIYSLSSKIRTNGQLSHLVPIRSHKSMGNHPSGSQIFRLPRRDCILRKVSTHPSHLHMGMAKLHHMAMIQMPLLLGSITVEVPSDNCDLL